MGRLEALQGRVVMAGGGLPQLVTGVAIRIDYAPGIVERGNLGGVLYGLREECAAVMPLFAAGFAGSVPTPGFAIKVSQPSPSEGLVSVTGASHDSRLVFLLLRLIEAAHFTPPGAWQRLLDSMDGDEEEARAVFSPRDLASDVLGIAVMAEGVGAVLPFDLGMPLGVVALPPLAQAIAGQMRDVDRMEFAVRGMVAGVGALEHGFLPLQSLAHWTPVPISLAPQRVSRKFGWRVTWLWWRTGRMRRCFWRSICGLSRGARSSRWS
jgi:hypothetical protein